MAKWYEKVWDFVKSGSAKDYANLTKAGIAALSSYASFKDQQKKTEMAQDAYDDYMKQAQAAGFEAQAAIDLNLTPMTVSGVPTTKADVTDFTAVAAKGGLMSIPNKQRKRYYAGTDEEEVMETEEEVLSPFDLQQETGIDLMGEQVKYNTLNPREGAWNVWNSGGIDQEIYEFDFEIFFESGDWMDMLKGQTPATGNMQMASAPDVDDELNEMYEDYRIQQIEIDPAKVLEFEDWKSMMENPYKSGGIAGLRHGGRPGYNIGDVVTADAEAVVSEVPQSQVNQIEAERELQTAYQQIFAKFYERFPNIDTEDMTIADMVALLQAEGVMEIEDLGILGLDRSLDMITPQSAERSAQRMSMGDTQWGDIPDQTGKMAKGGRPGYAFGPGPVVDQETMAESITLPDGGEEVVTDSMTEIEGQTAGGGDRGWRAQMLAQELVDEKYPGQDLDFYDLSQDEQFKIYNIALDMIDSGGNAKGGLPKRVRKDNGGIMNLGGLEKDYRTTGGFVPIGEYEKKDDVPARLSKNEFVMTADAVRAAGGGSINKGAQRMYDTMKHLEAQPQAKRMTA
tara:strand:- start:92 stop:1792 length:1701 start_codon:yes stop_codon:yes gene_type:complete